MSTSRAVLLLGMHRSGTSVVARGLQALSVYLGDDFLDKQPENPTGYWEDKGIVELNERVLHALGLRWDSVGLIDPAQLDRRRVRALRREAIRHCTAFTAQPVWGFKDPRTIRVLPFWREVLRSCEAGESYVVAIRNPRSVAASLFERQAMDADLAYRLWLVNMVPFLRELRGKPLVVVDYDLLMKAPRPQLERIGRGIGTLGDADPHEIDRFADEFLSAGLRHTAFAPDDLQADTEAARLTKEAYLLLYQLAQDRLDPNAASFWEAWEQISRRLEALVPERVPNRRWLGPPRVRAPD